MNGVGLRRSLLIFSFFLTILAGAFSSPAFADVSVTGSITQVIPSQNALTVAVGSIPVAVTVPPSAWVAKDRIDCGLVNLRVGDRARAVVTAGKNGGWEASRVDAQSLGQKKLLKGSLALLSPAGGLWINLQISPLNVPSLVLLDPATIVVRNNAPATLADLKIQDQLSVVAIVQPNGNLLANSIEASSSASQTPIVVAGFVKSVSGTSIVIQTWQNKVSETLDVDVSTVIWRDQKAEKASDLERGDQIVAFGQRDVRGDVDAYLISAQSSDAQFDGTIIAINPSEGWVIATPIAGGAPVKLNLLTPTLLQVNGRDADISDARLGDVAAIRALTSDNGPWTATSIEIRRAADG
jgi:hypothetical protein